MQLTLIRSCRLSLFIVGIMFLEIRIATSSCPFAPTNETLQKTCDWSSWLPWNCTCCGNDVSSQQTVRKRGICCDKDKDLAACFADCGYSAHADTEYGTCGSSCPLQTGNSICYTTTTARSKPTIPTTSRLPVAATTITASTTTVATTQHLTSSNPPTVTKLSRSTWKTSPVPSVSSTPDPGTSKGVSTGSLHRTSGSNTVTVNAGLRTASMVRNVTASESTKSVPVALVAGATGGGFLFLILLACLAIFLLKKKKKKSATQPQEPGWS